MPQSHKFLIRESPHNHLATSFLPLTAESDLAQDEQQAHKCPLPLDRDWAVPAAPWSPALTRHWSSSSCSSAMNWSWDLQGSTLGSNWYYPLYTCSTTYGISQSVDPMKVLTEGCSGAISSAMAVCCGWGHHCECCCHSFLCIAVALWNKCSNRKSPHYWCQIVF